jgi:hypothetical protein
MKCNINGKEYTYNSNIINNEQIRISFNELAKKIFGLNL